MVPAIKDKCIRQIAVCGFHSCALSERGVVYTWGEGKFGRLGHGGEGNEVTPRVVKVRLQLLYLRDMFFTLALIFLRKKPRP